MTLTHIESLTVDSGRIIDWQREDFMIDASKLDLIYYRAAVMALMKAKAASILESLPHTESVIYNQCQADASSTVVAHAKCLVKLFRSREQINLWPLPKIHRGMKAPETVNSHTNDLLGKPLTKDYDVSLKLNIDAEKSSVLETPGNKSLDVESSKTKSTSAKENLSLLRKDKSKTNSTNSKANSKTTDEFNFYVSKHIQKNSHIFRNLSYIKRKAFRMAEKEMDVANNKMMIKNDLKKLARRLKRKMSMTDSRICKPQSKDLELLLRFQRLYKMTKRISDFMDRLGGDISRMLQSHNFTLDVRYKIKRSSDPILNDLSPVNRSSSFILSPNLFSIFPNDVKEAEVNQKAEEYLSPTLFSFHKQGAFSLPALLAMLPLNEKNAWLELMLKISGVPQMLRRLLDHTQTQMKEIETKVYPAILKLERFQQRYSKFKEFKTEQQKMELEKFGYTIMTENQSSDIFGGVSGRDELKNLTKDELDEIIEQDVEIIAKLDEKEAKSFVENISKKEHKRSKRLIKTEKFGQVRMLNPYFFTHQVHDGAILRRVALSPRAFGMSLLSPDFFGAHVLSPSAFVPAILSPRSMIANVLSPMAFGGAILSPSALTAEVLSPRAFYTSILSPRALSAFILSPKALQIEVLTPKMLDFNVGTPTTLAFAVLSPTIMAPAIGSPLAFSMLVLSPNIMSPAFFSNGTGNVMVLSPTIFGQG